MAKRKEAVSLGKELVEQRERRRRNRLLGELLDQLDAEHGPVDESLVEKYVQLLR